MEDINIEKYCHSPELWYKIGNFLVSKEVRKELGGPISSNSNYTWYVLSVREEIIGFSSMEEFEKRIHFRHSYVKPIFRNKGFYNKLFKKRLRDSLELKKDILSTVTSMSLNTFLRNKFEITGTKGKYKKVLRRFNE